MISKTMVLQGACITVMAIITIAPVVKAQEPRRSFTGVKLLTSSGGNSLTCETNNPLTLYLRNKTISDASGCSGSVQPNGTFDGRCDNSSRQLFYRGQITGSTISLSLEFKYGASACRYTATLYENR
jgi:hypothetical protein